MRFIDNTTVLLSQVLRRLLKSSADVSIAVAFIRNSGVELIREGIYQVVAAGGRARVLVSKDMGFTEPNALRALEDIGAEIRVFVGRKIFHPKCYVFARSEGTAVVLGSSNMSLSGLSSGVEWNVELDERDGDLSLFSRAFDQLWTSEQTAEVSEVLLEEMQARLEELEGLSRHKGTIRRLDQEWGAIRFSFTVNASFLNYARHAITVPNAYYAKIPKQLQDKSPEAAIICPTGERVPGKLYCGWAGWGRYYQIRARHSHADPLSELRMGQNLSVEISLEQHPVEICLAFN